MVWNRQIEREFANSATPNQARAGRAFFRLEVRGEHFVEIVVGDPQIDGLGAIPDPDRGDRSTAQR